MALTTNLLAVLQTNAANASQENVDIISNYQKTITTNATALNDLCTQSTVTEALETRASLACAAALLVFGSKTITPQSSNYTAEEERNWSSDCWLPATCILKAHTSLDVALALRIATTMQATFAVRGAGHNANPGFGSIGDQGILLDLGEINQVILNDDKSIASIGTGSTWGAVYGILEEFNLTVAGGRSADVGVGGLLLGGGMSHFSNFWGLACDNVLNCELVLADSTIIQANPTENPDLFKALKGGGPNFGIVTRFDVRTFPGSELWYQFVVYNASDKDAVMAAGIELEKAMLEDNRIGFFLSDSPNALTAGMVYRGGPPSPDAFKAFDNITPLMVAVPPTNGTYQSCAITASFPKGQIWQIGGLTVASDAALYAKLHDRLAAFPNEVPISLSYTYQPFSAQGVAQGIAKGGNSLNLDPKNQAWLAFACSYTDPTLAETAISKVVQLMSQISNAAAAKGELLDLVFMNDANSLQSPISSYGADSVAFLESIRAKYDPDGVFQKLQNSGFLLSKK